MLVDTHCHLNFNIFDEDREDVLERAAAAGVTRILNPAIDLPTSRQVVAQAQAFPALYAAVGIHPNDALTWDENSFAELRLLAAQPKVCAIGEIGLDYYWDRAPQDLQRAVFTQQLQLALECALPVIIHVRDAKDGGPRAMPDVLDLLSEWVARLRQSGSPLVSRPGVLHSFSGDEADARRALALGFWIGITGPVTFRNAPGLQALVSQLPLESLVVETDAPFLTPHPNRGKRNEPAYVRHVADKIAQIHNRRPEDVVGITTEGAGRLFNW